MKQRKRTSGRPVKLKRGSSFDVLIAIIAVLTSAAFLYSLFSFKVIPTKWVMLIMLGLSFVLLILAFLSIVRTKRWISVVKRFLLLLIAIATSVGTLFVWRLKDSIYQIGNSTTTEIAYVLVKADSDIQKQSELSQKSVLYHDGTDADIGKKVQEALNKEVANIRYEKNESYLDMSEALLAAQCDAIIVPQSQYNYLTRKNENLSASVRILSEITYTKEHTSSGNINITEKPFVVFVSGMDEAGELNTDLHSDVNILMLVNPITNEMKMINIPRDSYLPNPALEYGNDKLTHTGMYGVENTLQTIENLFQVDIDYYVKINFSSLIEIVDTLDGINVDVQITFCEQDENRSFAQEDLICLNAGPQELNGKQALAYARHRDSYVDQDLSRNKAQVDIVKGIVKKILSPSGITKVDTLLGNVSDYVMTNFSGDEISAFAASELEDGEAWTISSLTISDRTFDSRINASAPDLGPLDVYLFSKEDVAEVREAIDSFIDPQKLSDFSFDLDDLHGKTYEKLKNNGVVYDVDAQYPH